MERSNAGLVLGLCAAVIVAAMFVLTKSVDVPEVASDVTASHDSPVVTDEVLELRNEVTLLREINARLREHVEVELVTANITYDHAVVRKVDHETGLAWISRGSADHLSPEAVFAVYSKRHHGVGRSDEDVKGVVQVTRIVGEHLAEVRILEEAAEDPIANNDPIDQLIVR